MQFTNKLLDQQSINKTEKAFENFARDFDVLEQQHSVLTNQLPGGKSTGEYPALATAAFAKEGESFKNRLRESLEQIMDKERMDLLWFHCNGIFGETFNSFGSRPRFRVLQRFDQSPTPAIDEYEAGHLLMTRGVPFDELPELFKPIVAEWKKDSTTPAPVTP